MQGDTLRHTEHEPGTETAAAHRESSVQVRVEHHDALLPLDTVELFNPDAEEVVQRLVETQKLPVMRHARENLA